MSEQYDDDDSDLEVRPMALPYRPLPSWLAARLLHKDEKVTWVYGPWLNPWWERNVTHPSLFLYTLAFGALLVAASALALKAKTEDMIGIGLVAGFFVIGSVIVLGIACGYFTRLVVTDRRLFIVQGYEMYRSWKIDDLPRSLIRYGARGARADSRAIDLDAVKSLLGSASDKFVQAKSILVFGKQLDQFKNRPDDR